MNLNSLKIYDWYALGQQSEEDPSEIVRLRQHNGRKAFAIRDDKGRNPAMEFAVYEGTFDFEKKSNPFALQVVSKDEAAEFLCGIDQEKLKLYQFSPIKNSPYCLEKARNLLIRMSDQAKQFKELKR